jgi:hypothetical protein
LELWVGLKYFITDLIGLSLFHKAEDGLSDLYAVSGLNGIALDKR